MAAPILPVPSTIPVTVASASVSPLSADCMALACVQWGGGGGGGGTISVREGYHAETKLIVYQRVGRLA